MENSGANHAAEHIEVLARQYEHLVETAATLKRIGSVENHLQELERARTEVQRQAALEVEAAHEAKIAHEALLIQLQTEAREIRAAAEQQRDEMLAHAQAEVAEIVRTGAVRLEQLKKAHDAAIAADLDKFEHLQGDIEESEASIEDLKVDIATLSAERDKVTKDLAAVRETIKKLSGV